MLNGTPETGVDYFAIYDSEGFEYSSESYGVMSWWDYGHYITTIASRIPNNNPFQAGVTGLCGADQYERICCNKKAALFWNSLCDD
jgi:dolichyl-diphosphooligosaccharide--protein glycosyltransferase